MNTLTLNPSMMHDWNVISADESLMQTTRTSGVGCLLFPIRPVPSFAPRRGSGSPHFFLN
ncbi:MAG: hypothetical protein IKO26_03905 [Paludibacteraceae bacterium]|nr:hypothetical protein [Paludibacteraceae bacterium]